MSLSIREDCERFLIQDRFSELKELILKCKEAMERVDNFAKENFDIDEWCPRIEHGFLGTIENVSFDKILKIDMDETIEYYLTLQYYLDEYNGSLSLLRGHSEIVKEIILIVDKILEQSFDPLTPPES